MWIETVQGGQAINTDALINIEICMTGEPNMACVYGEFEKDMDAAILHEGTVDSCEAYLRSLLTQLNKRG